MVCYYFELLPNGVDKEWRVEYSSYHSHFMCYGSNEAVMFVPGSYQEMMEDYG